MTFGRSGASASVVATALILAVAMVASCDQGRENGPPGPRQLGFLGEAKPSGVEDVPVPEVAELDRTDDSCGSSINPPCIEEVWRLPSAVSMVDLRSWYDQHAPNQEARESWQPCFGGRSQDDGLESLVRTWYRQNGATLGYITHLSADGTDIEIHLWSSGTPEQYEGVACQ